VIKLSNPCSKPLREDFHLLQHGPGHHEELSRSVELEVFDSFEIGCHLSPLHIGLDPTEIWSQAELAASLAPVAAAQPSHFCTEPAPGPFFLFDLLE